MRSGNVFWAGVLILVGFVLLMANLGWIPLGWNAIWPLLVIAGGVWLLWGALAGPRAVQVEDAIIPLADATEARVRINHGAGNLSVGPGAAAGNLVEGTFGGGLDYQADRVGETLRALSGLSSPYGGGRPLVGSSLARRAAC